MSLPVSLAHRSSPGQIPKSIFKGIQDDIDKEDFPQAINILSLLLIDAHTIPDLEQAYTYLFNLFTHFTDASYRNFAKNLPNLLDATPHLPEEQMKLALRLAARSIATSSSQSMSYYASALQIATYQHQEERPYHILASKLFFLFLENHQLKNGAFLNQIDNALSQADESAFKTLLEQLLKWSQFCFSEEETALLKTVYNQIAALMADKNPSTQSLFRSYVPQILQHRTDPIPLATIPVTENYTKALRAYRTHFKTFLQNQNPSLVEIKEFQNFSSKQFDSLISLFLEDAFTILGPPPCSYDVRAMGSCGRKEQGPFSDLEPFILVSQDDEKTVHYFTQLLKLLDLQIRSLGETADLPLTFTCLGKTTRSGLHLDRGENISDLIKTPKTLASLQAVEHPVDHDPTVADPSTMAHTALKSRSLHSNTHTLYTQYQDEVSTILTSKPFQSRFLKYIKKRWIDFAQLKASPDLKKEYVEPLYHLLSDLSLYYDIDDTNTLDMIDALVTKNVFTKESGELLKEAVAQLYVLRLRLHDSYNQQKEEALFEPHLGGYTLSSKEKLLLDKIRHLVLSPIYNSVFAEQNTFYKFDLFQKALDQVISSQDPMSLKTTVQLIALHLLSIKAPVATHEHYFRQLSQHSKTDPLREAYFNAAQIEELALIPNRSGLRLAFSIKASALDTALQALTLDNPPPNHPQVKVITPTFTRYLSPNTLQDLLDKNGDIKRSYPASAHLVSASCGLHFKQKPTHPLMEYAIHNLFFRIAGHLTPTTQLIRFEVTHKGTTKSIPSSSQKTIPGQTLKEQNPDPSSEGWKQWTWLLLCSILTRPGDGLLSNYITTPSTTYCIDNDISFVEPALKSKINFCSALFCFLPTQGLSPEVLKAFCNLDIDSVLNGWIEDVIEKEKEYLALFSQQERQRFYDENENNQFKATILFREGTLATLNLQFYKLQNYLIAVLQKKQEITALDLLKQLINLRESPTLESGAGVLVFKAYDNARSITSVDRQLQQITSRKQDGMSLTSMQSDVACLGKVPSWHDVEKLALYTPSKAREELMSTLLKRSADYISTGNIQGKKVVRASFKEMQADEERQKLVLQALTYLITIETQKPASVTLQYCSVLDSKTLTPFLNDKLEYLDLRSCTKIRDKDIETIQTHCPQIKELHLTGCSSLKELSISRWPLASIPLEMACLQTLECSKCESLQALQLNAPRLRKLKASNNPHLKKVDLMKSLPSEINVKGSGQVKLSYDPFAFGQQAWANYFGDVGVEPPLPAHILNILEDRCPFWPGKKVRETHLLTLIPATVNGQPLTLKLLGELVQKPLKGNKTKYEYFYLGEYTDPAAPKSHWALMTKDVIEGSRSKSYSEQQRLIKPPYEVPTVLDATVTILMEYVKSGTRLYGDSPYTYTRCQEKYDERWQLSVGGFSPGGLVVRNRGGDSGNDGVGGGLWKL